MLDGHDTHSGNICRPLFDCLVYLYRLAWMAGVLFGCLYYRYLDGLGVV